MSQRGKSWACSAAATEIEPGVYAPIGGGSLAGRVRLGARGRRFGRGRGARFAAATLVAMLAAAFAFSAPALAQEAPPADSSTTPTDSGAGVPPATGGAGASESEDATDPTTEPTPTPGAGTEESDPPPPGSETTPPDTPADTPPPADETAPGGGVEPAPSTCTPPAGDAGSGAATGAPGECAAPDEPACETAAVTPPPAATTDSPTPPASAPGGAPATGCDEGVKPDPTPATPPPAPSAPPSAPEPDTSQATTAAPFGIVLLVPDSAGTTAAAAPQDRPEVANRLAAYRGRLAPLAPVVLDGLEESASELADVGSDEVLDPELAFDARWLQSIPPSRRDESCTPIAGTVSLSSSCPSYESESILTAPPLPWVGKAPNLRERVAQEAAERRRRTHPEARSDTERPTVAVAPVGWTRDHGRLGSGGSSGGSSVAAGLRIFAVSTSPLSLSAPVDFPTEPQPTLLPKGEPGVPPSASPG